MKTFVTSVALALVATVGLMVAAPAAKAADAQRVTVRGGDVETFTVRMAEGDHLLTVSGDGDTQLLIRVYNESGRLIAKGTNDGGITYTTITAPPGGGKVTVEVTNLGLLQNTFRIAIGD
jgi:YD repeat-containing protein